eukprot:4708812-Amphidinium_carterae.1
MRQGPASLCRSRHSRRVCLSCPGCLNRQKPSLSPSDARTNATSIGVCTPRLQPGSNRKIHALRVPSHAGYQATQPKLKNLIDCRFGPVIGRIRLPTASNGPSHCNKNDLGNTHRAHKFDGHHIHAVSLKQRRVIQKAT